MSTYTSWILVSVIIFTKIENNSTAFLQLQSVYTCTLLHADHQEQINCARITSIRFTNQDNSPNMFLINSIMIENVLKDL